jgi:FSR family fosmidomycin resistance protein-like MFS transporter
MKPDSHSADVSSCTAETDDQSARQSATCGDVEKKGLIASLPVSSGRVMPILVAISFSHLLNDTIQSLIPAIYPLLKSSLFLDFTQIGLITFTFQVTASILQPVVGFFTDRRPMPYSLTFGMAVTLVGLIVLARAGSYSSVICAAALVGIGSSIFHPEASRLAHLAAGGKYGFAQSLFQVGGNAGSSLGPLLAAAIIVPRGTAYIIWFCPVALLGMAVLATVGRWYQRNISARKARGIQRESTVHPLARGTIVVSLIILIALIFSKYFYLASLSSYYTFYLISKFGLSIQAAQIYLFLFLFAVAAGTIIGGPVGDRVGRKRVIWISILGVAPFSLLLPHANLFWTGILSIIIGVILASAFSAILVYAQQLVPGKVGLIAGLFFGLAFGMAGIGSALLGKLADHTSIGFVYNVCSTLPLLGLLTAFLPEVDGPQKRAGGGNG